MSSPPPTPTWKKLLPTAIVLLFTVAIAFLAKFTLTGTLDQWRTSTFTQTQGQIDRIERTEHDGDETTTYGVDIAYHYFVDAKRYDSKRIRYRAGSSSDNWASQFVRQHPAGSNVTVYYDPAHPGESVLTKGLEGFDLFKLMFTTPFLCVGIGLCGALLWSWRKTGLAGLNVTESGSTIRLRPSMVRAIFIPLAALGFSAFIAVFIVGFGFGGFHPSLAVAQVAWIIIGCITLLSIPLTVWWITAGRGDIILEGEKKVLRFKQYEIPYARIQRLEVRKEEQKDSEGDSQITWSVWILQDLEPRSLRLKKCWGDQDGQTSKKLTTYLALQTGLEALDEHGKTLIPANGQPPALSE